MSSALKVASIEHETLPVVTLKLLTGTAQEGGRSAGIFTVDDLIKIFLYVRQSRQLPQTLEAVVKMLGASSTGIPGLEPSDVFNLYTQISGHGNRWTRVESQVIDQAAALTVAASEIVRTGDTVISVIDEMDIVAKLKELRDTSIVIPITTDKDQKIKLALPEILQKLKAIGVTQQQRSRQVLTAVRDYKIEVSGGELSNGQTTMGLEPQVADKKERAKQANLDGKITALQTEIDSLEKQIDQLKKDYDKYVGLAFSGAAGGLIGIAITGGIFGAKAEQARKRRNQLITTKAGISEELRRDQQVQGALNSLATGLSDVGMRLLDAETALNHLDFLWADVVARIDDTVNQWEGVTDSSMLLSIVVDLNGIVSPWREVGELTVELARVFDQATAEFRKTYAAE